MTLEHDPGTPRRVAALRLRGPHGTVAARAFWPAAVWPRLLVAFDLDDADASRLCVEAALVVLSAAPRGAADAGSALAWAADNLPDLSAHGPLLLAGAGAGAARAGAAAAAAARAGWPPVRHLFLLEPEIGRPAMSNPAPLVRRTGEGPLADRTAVPTTTITPGPDQVSELVAAIDRVTSTRTIEGIDR